MKRASHWARACNAAALTVALVANLVAAGVPVLHAMAHELAEESHHGAQTSAADARVEHGHDEVHPASLHDERFMVKRISIDLSFIVPAPVSAPVAFTAPATVQHRATLRLLSRAPPSADLARAPPTA